MLFSSRFQRLSHLLIRCVLGVGPGFNSSRLRRFERKNQHQTRPAHVSARMLLDGDRLQIRRHPFVFRFNKFFRSRK